MGAFVRTPPLLVVVLLVAVALGAGASLLAGAIPAARPVSSSAPGYLTLPAYVWGIVFLLPLVVGFAGILLRRRQGSGMGLPERMSATALVMVAILVGFLLLAQYFGSNTGGLGTSKGAKQGGGGGSTNGTNGSNNSSGSGDGGTLVTVTPWGLSSWLWFALVVTVALVGAFVLLPMLQAARRSTPSSGTAPPAREAAQTALATAQRQLHAGADPREVILALYGQLLDRVAPLAGDLAARTAAEIRDGDLTTLGVRREASVPLTALFEEARYSTHPMGPETSRRAQEAIRLAETDLLRAVGAR